MNVLPDLKHTFVSFGVPLQISSVGKYNLIQGGKLLNMNLFEISLGKPQGYFKFISIFHGDKLTCVQTDLCRVI